MTLNCSGAELDHVNLHLHDWHYVAEGNSCLVLRRKDTENSHWELISSATTVLRVCKHASTSRISNISQHHSSVCRYLYGHQYIVIGKDFYADQVVTKQLLSKFSRRQINNDSCVESEFGFNHCTLSIDLTSIWLPNAIHDYALASKVQCRPSTLTLEIKPKLGSLPRSLLVSPGNHRLKYTVPRFKALQSFKIYENYRCRTEREEMANLNYGRTQMTTSYSPFDLFSQKRKNILHALRCLVIKPNNYLKVFECGKLISINAPHETETSAAEMLIDDASIRAVGLNIHDLLHSTACILECESLLQNILSIQRLDVIEVEGAKLIYDRLAYLCHDGPNSAEHLIAQALVQGIGWIKDMNECQKWLHQWNEILFTDDPNCLSASELDQKYQNACQVVNSLAVQDCIMLLNFWYLAQAASDCCVFLALSTSSDCNCLKTSTPILQQKNSAGHFCVREGNCLSYCMSAIDIGPKPMSQLSKQLKREPLVWEYVSRVQGLNIID